MSLKNLALTALLVLAAVFLGSLVWFQESNQSRPENSSKIVRSGKTFRSDFSAMHESTAHGTASIRALERTFEVSISLEGLKSDARYNTHLHKGSCSEPGGGGIQLNPVIAGNSGTGTSTTSVSYDEINPTFDHLIMVHAPDQAHILCADTPRVSRLKTLGND
ncbi:MAG: hypothetical protein ABEK50_08345 [bacterium]